MLEVALGVVLQVVLGLVAASVAYTLYCTVRGLHALIEPPEQVEPRSTWPRVSMIVPACNEADTLEAATRAKLSSDYPNLELVLIDDRSTDGTSEIVDRIAANDPRVRAVHISELPPGWLGKVHALSRGCEGATGEWLLFCDADVHIDSDFLRRVMAESLRRDLEFVTLLPRILSSSFALDVALATFTRILVASGRLWLVADPRSRVAVGGGVFNLVERRALDRTRGLEWLRLEIADDVALGQMLKRSGARSAVFDGTRGVHLHFYRSLGEMMRGLEKNAYAVFGGLRPLQLALMLSLMVSLELFPVVALALPSTTARVAGAAMLATTALSQALVARAGRRGIGTALVPALGPLLLSWFGLRSAVLAHLRGGIVWRGTHYSLAELRAGRRFEVF